MCSQDWKPLVGSRPNNSFLLGLSSCCFLSSIFCPPWQGGKGRSRAWCSRALHTAQCNAGDRRGPQQMLVYGSINQFCFPIRITLRSRFGETISSQQHLSHGWRELCIWPDTGLPSGPHKLGLPTSMSTAMFKEILIHQGSLSPELKLLYGSTSFPQSQMS